MKRILEKLDRRTLIGAGVLGAAGMVYLGTVGAGVLEPCASQSHDTAALKSLIRLGRIYLREHGSGSMDLPSAHKAVLRGGRPDRAAMRAEYDRVAAGLLEERQRDFEEGRIVRCGGWVIAHSEARLCAMVVLAAA